MAEPHRVARLSDLDTGKQLSAQVGDQHLALFRVGGDVVATEGKCPHAGGPLHKGTVCEGKLTCPWHGWSYDLATGECDQSDDITLPRFAVRVEGDDILVML